MNRNQLDQDRIDIISPIDGQVFASRKLADGAEIEQALAAAQKAQKHWQSTDIADRKAIIDTMLTHFRAQEAELVPELARMMGRPVRFGGGEINGYCERASHMAECAETALADIVLPEKAGFDRHISRRPLGVVLVIAAWNYPYLIAVNSIAPALMAGNAVILKHAAQTLPAATRMVRAFQQAGLPEGLLTHLVVSHAQTADIIADNRIAHVNFTGSVAGGRAIQAAARGRFIGVGLELGGKDPAYVRADADLPATAAALVDGSFFNSGQSCCGIERIYADARIYDALLDLMRAETEAYILGDPLHADTTLGPMVSADAANGLRAQIKAAQAMGASGLIDRKGFAADQDGNAYCAPQILVNVSHDMAIMREESFGPVVGVMKTDSDEAALALVNDSAFGLTASIWTSDMEVGRRLAPQIETGTVFVNRCDYLDPGLAWTGIGDSGRGATLSQIGFEQLTRPMSFHIKHNV